MTPFDDILGKIYLMIVGFIAGLYCGAKFKD